MPAADENPPKGQSGRKEGPLWWPPYWSKSSHPSFHLCQNEQSPTNHIDSIFLFCLEFNVPNVSVTLESVTATFSLEWLAELSNA